MELHAQNATSFVNASNLSNLDSNVSDNGGIFKIVKIIIAIIVTLLIICNNIVNMIVLKKMRDINRRMKILLFSLSISDFCLGVIVCIPAVVSGVLDYWPFSAVVCQMTGTMNGVAISVSLWSLMAISIERCVLIKKVTISRHKETIVTVIQGVAFIWIFNITFFAFPIFLEDDFIYYRYDPDVISCSFRWKSSVYFIIAKIVYPILSGTVILICNIWIHFLLQKALALRRHVLSKPGNFNISPSKLSGLSCDAVKSRKKSNRLVNVQDVSTSGCQNVPAIRIDNRETLNTSHRNGSTDLANGNKFSAITKQSSESSPISNLVKNHVQRGKLDAPLRSTANAPKVEADKNSISEHLMPRSAIRRNMKAVLLLVCTSVVFFATVTPYMVSSLIDHFLVDWKMPAPMKFAALWTLKINSFINVYIYSAIYSEFRSYCQNLISDLADRCCGAAASATHAVRQTGMSLTESVKEMSAARPCTNDVASLTARTASRYYANPGVDNDQTRRNTGVGNQDDTRVDGNGSLPSVRPEKLALTPRNDAGVPCQLPTLSACRTVAETASNNQNTATTTMNYLQIRILPSIDV